jgi:peptide chain release factor subunit 3
VLLQCGDKTLDESHIQNGFVLCDAKRPCKVAIQFDAQIRVLPLLPHKPLLSAGYQAVLHLHTLVDECEVLGIKCELNKKGKEAKQRPPFLTEGKIGIVRIQTELSIAMESYKDVSAMGRFTLRDEGKTIAIGKIIKVYEKAKKKVRED